MAYSTHDGYLGVGKQSAKGTAIAPTDYIRYRDKNINPEIESEFYHEGGYGRDVAYGLKTMHKHDGSFSLLARPKQVGLLMHALLGADSMTGTATPYHHTITPDDTIDWYTFETGEVKTSNLVIERIQDCKVNSIKISGEAGKPVTLDVDFLGIQAVKQAAASSPSYESNDPFRFYEGTFTVDSSATTYITKFDITINNNVAGDIQTVEVHRDDMVALSREITVDFTLKLTDATQYAAIMYGGSTAVSDDLDEGDFTIDLNYGTGATARQFKIEIPKLYYIAAEMPRGADPEVIYLSCSGRAVKGASNIITCVVQNDASTDYDS